MVSVPPADPLLFSFPKNHSGEFSDDLVTALPEFQSCEVTREDSFCILACDGLWDVLSHDEVVKVRGSRTSIRE